MHIRKEKEIRPLFDFFVGEIVSNKLKKICQDLVKYKDFWTFPASIGHHHSFKYGLILHTLEVTNTALHKAKLFKNCDNDILITAALWHDLAKIWDIKPTTGTTHIEFQKAEYFREVHHISGSNAEFTAVAAKFGLDRATVQKVQHCIISHHGSKDWGSPVVPNSLEAILLHQSDMLSAKSPLQSEIKD